jgi:hypothetical protein
MPAANPLQIPLSVNSKTADRLIPHSPLVYRLRCLGSSQLLIGI